MLIRPIAMGDLPGLMELAASAGVGMTTLPTNETALRARIAASEATFAGAASKADALYLFAFVDEAAGGKLAGVCGILGAVGLAEPWYTYRVGLVVHASKELGVFTQTPTLFLSNDHTGASELCSLFLAPAYRRDGYGALLSKCRFLFMAQFPDRFAREVIAELRGVTDANGRSPFWESLGRHFFSMEFSEADYLTGIGNKSFVAELMPKHPLYTSFLTAEAQAAIGQTHELTLPARRLLEAEGFRYDQHVDIFDAGPTIECALADIGAVRASRVDAIAAIADASDARLAAAPRSMVATLDMAGFRLAAGRLTRATRDVVVIERALAKTLHLSVGDRVRHVAISPKDRGTSP